MPLFDTTKDFPPSAYPPGTYSSSGKERDVIFIEPLLCALSSRPFSHWICTMILSGRHCYSCFTEDETQRSDTHAQGHTTRKWWSQAANPHFSDSAAPRRHYTTLPSWQLPCMSQLIPLHFPTFKITTSLSSLLSWMDSFSHYLLNSYAGPGSRDT